MTKPKQSSKHAASPRRRRAPGSAWHWAQTDAWYYTSPGSKRRVALFDSAGKRIKGKSNKQAANLALARLKAREDWKPSPEPSQASKPMLVATICSEYVQFCASRVQGGHICAEYGDRARRTLNDLASYCGALPVDQMLKSHLEYWLESHSTWRSPVTRRSALTAVLAAFEHARENHGIQHSLRGFPKPGPKPRLHALSREEEHAIYKATDKPFRDFLFAAIHTGLRPFCELARLRVRDVQWQGKHMLWRIYSSKTKKTRKIPIRSEVAKLLRQRLKVADQDAILLPNPQGRAWKKVTGVRRFREIKRKLGWDLDPVRKHFSTYSCRHTFAYRLLAGYWNHGAGCTIETLAELLGNTPQVAFAHYGREWGQHFQDPLWAAIGQG